MKKKSNSARLKPFEPSIIRTKGENESKQKVWSFEDASNLEKFLEEEGQEEITFSKALTKILAKYAWTRNTFAYDEKETQTELKPLNVAVLISPEGTHFTAKLHSMAESMRIQTESVGYVIYLKNDISNELFICPKDETFFYFNRYILNIDTDKTVSTYVIRHNKPMIVSTMEADMRFPNFQGIQELNSSDILSIPITDFTGNTHGVFEVYRDNSMPYGNDDLEKISFVLQWVAEGIKQNKERVIFKRFREINNILLETIHENFGKEFQKNADFLLNKLVHTVKRTFDAESATIFLVTQINELKRECTTDYQFKSNPQKQKLRLKKEIELANIAKDSKSIINLADVYNDPRFDKEIDIKTGKIIRSVLSTPIIGSKGNIFGVLQILNKLSEDTFTEIDESFIKTFGQSCALWLYYKKLSGNLFDQKILNDETNNLFYYQLSTLHTLTGFFNIDETIYVPKELATFDFNTYPEHITEISKFIFYMFLNISKDILSPIRKFLYDFILMVKRSYRNAEFHTFQNAFLRVHMIFVFIKIQERSVSNYFTEIEKLTLMISSLCLHIDSTGELIEYWGHNKSSLFELYENSPIEMHQSWLTKFIVKASKLIDHIPFNEQQEILNMIQENILSKNNILHLNFRLKLRYLFDKKKLDDKLPEHRLLIRALILESSTFVFHAKPVSIATSLIDDFIRQYRRQTEYVKNLKEQAISELEDEVNLKKFHFELVKFLYIPCFELLKDLFPFTEILLKRCRDLQFILIK